MTSYQRKSQPVALAIICLSLLFLGFVVGRMTGAGVEVEPKEVKVRLDNYSIDKINNHTTSETAPARKIEQQINAIRRIRYLSDRGGTGKSWTDRLRERLKGTAFEGKERQFVLAAADAGIHPTLSYAIAYHESGGFVATPPGSNNYAGIKYGDPALRQYGYTWGKGPDGRFKYQAFPSKEVFIKEHAAFIARIWGRVNSPYQMRGYAQSPSWAAKVATEMGRV